MSVKGRQRHFVAQETGYMGKTDFKEYLVKLSNACRFLMKGDAVVFGAIITMAGTLKLEQKETVDYVTSHTWLFAAIGSLIALGLIVETAATTVIATTDGERNEKLARILRWAYFAYVSLQLFGMGFFIGWTVKTLELISKA